MALRLALMKGASCVPLLFFIVFALVGLCFARYRACQPFSLLSRGRSRYSSIEFFVFSGALPPRDADSDDESLASSICEDENTVTALASPAHRPAVSPIQHSKLRPVEENLEAVAVAPLPPHVIDEDVTYDSDGSWGNEEPVPAPKSSSSHSRTVMVQLPTFHPRQLDLTAATPDADVEIAVNMQEVVRTRVAELSFTTGSQSDEVDIEGVPFTRRPPLPVDMSCETIDIATSRVPEPVRSPMVLAVNQCGEVVEGSPHQPSLTLSSPQASIVLEPRQKDYRDDIQLVPDAMAAVIVSSRAPYDEKVLQNSRKQSLAALGISSPQGRQSCQSNYSEEFDGSRIESRSDRSRPQSRYSIVRSAKEQRVVVRDQSCQTECEDRVMIPRPTKQSSIPRLIRQGSSSSSVSSCHPETTGRSSRPSLPSLPLSSKQSCDENPERVNGIRSSPIQMRSGRCDFESLPTPALYWRCFVQVRWLLSTSTVKVRTSPNPGPSRL
jgi:hypothetical protein